MSRRPALRRLSGARVNSKAPTVSAAVMSTAAEGDAAYSVNLLTNASDVDDGTTLSLYRNGSKFVAEVSGKEPFEIVATKSGNFVAVNGSTQLKFVQDAGGKVASVVLTKS